MRAVIQRVNQASVEVNDQLIGKIQKGVVIFLGVSQADTEEDAVYLSQKISNMRIFEDKDGKMNLSLKEINGGALAIAQFTLYANTRKGRRPSFIEAALPDKANVLYEHFIQSLKEENIDVSQGVFGAMMHVRIENYGPVTIILNSSDRPKPRN
jgi:D-tyrosyl-tRNA(Tyr) deacylase